jgi:hypothetical protein
MLLWILVDGYRVHDAREVCCAGRREDPKSKRPKRRVSRICGVAFSSKAVVLICWPQVVDTAISNGPETYPRPLQFVIHFIAVMDTVISAKLEVCLQPCQHTYVMDEAVAERLQCPSTIHNDRAISPRGERALSSWIWYVFRFTRRKLDESASPFWVVLTSAASVI